MTRRHSKPLAGLAYLALIACLVMTSVAAFNKALPWQGAATVVLTTASPGLELNPHSDVKLQGLRVGEVRRITSNGRTAEIELAVDHDKLELIPANIDAAIVPKTLFGEKFVDLRLPKAPASARLAAGGVIQQSTTSVEIGAVFSDLVPVLEALKPEQLSVVLNSLAQALDGRGQTLARTLDQLQAFLARVDPHLQTFAEDIALLGRTADVYADGAPDLLEVLSATAGISRELLLPEEQELGEFLDQVIATGDRTTDVLRHNAANLIRLSGRARPVLDLLHQYSKVLPCLLKGLHTVDILGNQTIGARGPFTNLIVDVIGNNGGYTNPADLPSNPSSEANNANLPDLVPGWAPHCPQFSAEVLALKDAAPNSMPLQGTALDVPKPRSSIDQARPGSASTSTSAVDEARRALARAIAARSLGVAPDEVPAYVGLLLDPMLSDGEVRVR
jgi:phospholipid/cholesterol/gamma-HCH transport system substrate-binding protein